jgi:hypothetical protein
MDLEIMLSEISQNERDKYSRFSHLWKLDLKKKKVNDTSIKQGDIGEGSQQLREKAKGKGEGKVSIMEVFCMHV